MIKANQRACGVEENSKQPQAICGSSIHRRDLAAQISAIDFAAASNNGSHQHIGGLSL